MTNLINRWNIAPDLNTAVTLIASKIKKRKSGQSGNLEGLLTDEWFALAKNSEVAKTVLPHMIEVSKQLRRWRAASECMRNAREHLLCELQLGSLAAAGFPIHMDDVNGPVLVPTFLWQAEFIEWNKSRVHGAGREFHLVRVLDPYAPELAASEPPVGSLSEAPKKRGRRTAAAEILEAYNALQNSGVPLAGKSHQDIHSLIVPKVHELHPGKFAGDAGLSYNSVCRALGLFPSSKFNFNLKK